MFLTSCGTLFTHHFNFLHTPAGLRRSLLPLLFNILMWFFSQLFLSTCHTQKSCHLVDMSQCPPLLPIEGREEAHGLG